MRLSILHSEKKDANHTISVIGEYKDNVLINTFILLHTNGIFFVFKTLTECFRYTQYQTYSENMGLMTSITFDELYDYEYEGFFEDRVEWWVDDNLLKAIIYNYMLLCEDKIILSDDTEILNKMEKDLNNISRDINNSRKTNKVDVNYLDEVYDNTKSILLRVAILSLPVFDLYYKYFSDFEDISYRKKNYELYAKYHKPYNKIKNKCFFILDKIESLKESNQIATV